MDDAEVDRVVRRRQDRTRHRQRVDLHHLTLGQSDLPGRSDLTVDAHPAGLDRRRGLGTTEIADQRHDPVEAFTGERGRDRLADHDDGSPDG